ncbi:phosphoadenylyl-sulfate reductase [Sulfurimonas sp.]|uniref:phosphoadenylyl-sulfate reductase n=1 Tax=Sulfurimonas sp. TaxID=2022749 RepID=UPI002B4A0CF7|nr:phosphoadenylyl-sulfate reductase [Sulfurimonas sp.]
MDTTNLNKRFKNLSPQEILEYFLKKYGTKAALSSSFGAEDQVITDMLLKLDKKANIFTLDTGRLHPQTYSVMDATNLKYGVKVNVFFPKTDEVQKLYQEQGVNGFYESIENRKSCCYVRKIEPLQRALGELSIWITGLRATQSVTREELNIIEFDKVNKVIKVNPLLLWSEEDVWTYIKENKVPYNSLHDEGFPSIGCAPCTRAIKDGDYVRSGRWWWENPEHKECGLHTK